jgi:predicted transcriptional regulator
MAKATNTVTITLQDDSKLTLRPLNIRLFREFQERWAEMMEENVTNVLDQVDALIDLAVICISREIGEKKDDREWLEEVLDFDTIYLVLKECADVDLNPANATATAIVAAAQSGQSSS